MKEKVKDLDPVLQKLIEEKVSIQFNKPDLYAEPLLEMIDWKLATNEERLKYAELMYPVGTLCKGINKDTAMPNFIIKGAPYFDSVIGVESESGDYRTIYRPSENKWAEIISRPDEKEEMKERINNYFENTNPEQLKKDWEETKEPEFHPGEMVEYPCIGTKKIKDWKPCRNTGGKTSKGEFIVEVGPYLITTCEIRKIQPDPEKEIEKKARQIRG